MSAHKPRATAADPIDWPFLDDAERAESAWLLARDADPAAPAPSPQLPSEYDELEGLLADLPSVSSDKSWQEAVLNAGLAPPRPPHRAAWKWAAGGAALTTAAAIAVIALWPRPEADELEWVTRRNGSVRSSKDDVTVGDRLIVTARPQGNGELRVYRGDGVLVARCPRGPGCQGSTRDAGDAGKQVIEITLDAPVQYHLILAIGDVEALPELSLNTYVDAARAAGARIVTSSAIDVH